MNKNLVIVLAGGFLIAILVAMIVQASLSGKDKRAPVKAEARVQIAVAAKELAAGTELDAEAMKWQDWPKAGVFPGAIVRKGDQDVEDAIKGRVRQAVKAGDPIMDSAVIKAGAGNIMAANLGEGMRAVAINVSAVSTAGGFIQAGDYVDLILTYKKTITYDGPENKQIDDMLTLNFDRTASETILQNVKVLAIDQAPRRDDEKAAKVGKTVTLEVDLRSAEILAVAKGMGDLSLALRKLGDDREYARDYAIVTDERITNISDELYNEMVRIQNSSGQEADIVRIYNGSSVTQTAVGQ